MSNHEALLKALRAHHPQAEIQREGRCIVITEAAESVPDLAVLLTEAYACDFATLVVEHEASGGFAAHYFFHTGTDGGWIIQITTSTDKPELPSISDQVHAADWHEREAEDMFEIVFRGHPFLGDFVLHDTQWPEGIAPLRRDFDYRERVQEKGKGGHWQPRRLLEERGALVFPVGPVWADYAETGLWLLETPGEQIRQAHSRLFYKFRGVEKIAEEQPVEQALLLAERFSGSAAVAHAIAYCQAVEDLADCEVPPRAGELRVVLAEFERMRYHAATIAELAGSTGLVVAKAMGQEIQEGLLRLAGDVFGHRYLFGLLTPGGLGWEPDTRSLERLDEGVRHATGRIERFERLLINSSSFLDRIEQMGTLDRDIARLYGVVGPVARASGRSVDLRRSLPYGSYKDTPFAVACEGEGDGYARLRVYFNEIRASASLIHEHLSRLSDGPIRARFDLHAGAALGWVEAPAGAAFHWVRLDEAGRIRRWRIGTPGFRNWHAFHRAVEGAAFQDFPIILASFGLSVAENDR